MLMHARIQKGDFRCGPPHLKKHKATGFLSNTCPDLLKNLSTKPALNVRPSSGPPAKRHFNSVSLAGRLWPAFSGIRILSPLINLMKKKKETPMTKLSGYVHVNKISPRMSYTLIAFVSLYGLE